MTLFARRRIARAFGVLVCGAAVAQVSGAAASRQPILLWDSLFSDCLAACCVGNSYLKSFPCRADHRLLLEQLNGCFFGERIGFCLEGVVGAESLRSARLKILEKVKSDFSKGHVVSVDGWVLSVTECDIFGLISLRSA